MCVLPGRSKNLTTISEIAIYYLGKLQMKRLKTIYKRLKNQIAGAAFVEYLLLMTLVGIGVIAGLATVRVSLLNELADLANAINAIGS